MGRFPHCKKFISEEAPKYGSLEIKTVGGKSPAFVWLNARNEVIGEEYAVRADQTVEDIIAVLAEHNIREGQTDNSGRLKATTSCIAFRAVAADGTRLPGADVACLSTVSPGAGIGFCECANKENIDVAIAQTRTAFTCESVCISGKVPWERDEEL